MVLTVHLVESTQSAWRQHANYVSLQGRGRLQLSMFLRVVWKIWLTNAAVPPRIEPHHSNCVLSFLWVKYSYWRRAMQHDSKFLAKAFSCNTVQSAQIVHSNWYNEKFHKNKSNQGEKGYSLTFSMTMKYLIFLNSCRTDPDQISQKQLSDWCKNWLFYKVWASLRRRLRRDPVLPRANTEKSGAFWSRMGRGLFVIVFRFFSF